MDLVSVVVPVHNGEKYLKKTTRGILNQSYKNIELILVENFSTDNSFKICKEIANKDNRVIVVQSFIKGISMARKKGVEVAKCKYLCEMKLTIWLMRVI